MTTFHFNNPPGWPTPSAGWKPDANWSPEPSWPPAPIGWNFWITNNETDESDGGQVIALPQHETIVLNTDRPADLRKKERRDSQQSSDSDDISSANHLQVLEQQIATLHADLDNARKRLAANIANAEDAIEFDDARLLQEVGIYEYRHPLENAEQYREQLANLRNQIKESVKSHSAIEASDKFAYNNSLAQGRKMTSDFSKLMLRAYNAEADNCIRSLRAGALITAIKRLETSSKTIARLGKMMEMRVADKYHGLRIQELELTADYLFKQQEERETAREERERLREEKKVEQELQTQREKLDKEKALYANTLVSLRTNGATLDEIEAIEARLREIDVAIEVNDYRAANIRAGYVYVISNIGAFGESVVKIGLTRRLEPLDRIRELGDASVPFPFDVHALYFSEDAVSLEAELHREFKDCRLNNVNTRREFFFATPAEVRDVLMQKVGNLLDYVEKPEAEQYFQSLSIWPTTAIGQSK